MLLCVMVLQIKSVRCEKMTIAQKYVNEINKTGIDIELMEKIYKWSDGSMCIDFEDNSFLVRCPDCEEWKAGSYDDVDNEITYDDFVSNSY